MMPRRAKPTRPWYLVLIGLAAVALVVVGVLELGAPASGARVAHETVTAEDGIIQSTVSGSGNVEPATDVEVNFQASGTLAAIDVKLGQHVRAGQLLATLDPSQEQLAVDQAQESLSAAEDQLASAEADTSATSGGSGGGGGSSAGSGAPAQTDLRAVPARQFVSYSPGATTTTPAATTTTGRGGTTTTAAGGGLHTTTTRGSGATAGSGSSSTTTTTSTPSPSAIASAQAAVYGAEANLRSAELALAKTKLYAPVSGTIVSLESLSTGDSVSAGSTGAASSGGSTASGSSSSAGGGAGSGGSGSGAGAGSSGTSFAEIVSPHALRMTVSLSESDISSVRVGQSATVTLDALSGVELAAHVSSISTVGTVSSGVVSYNATLSLDQSDPRVKPGMSASASIITGQAQGVTVPNQALSGSGSLASVQLVQNGRAVTHQVVVGLRGTSRSQIVSGLSSGQQLMVTITLPSLNSSSSASASGALSSRLGRFLGSGGFGGVRVFGGGGGGGGGSRSGGG